MTMPFGLRKGTRCDLCNRKFSSVEDLMNHKQTVHGKDLRYDCRVCNRYFHSMEEMRTHLQREHVYTGSDGGRPERS